MPRSVVQDNIRFGFLIFSFYSVHAARYLGSHFHVLAYRGAEGLLEHLICSGIEYSSRMPFSASHPYLTSSSKTPCLRVEGRLSADLQKPTDRVVRPSASVDGFASRFGIASSRFGFASLFFPRSLQLVSFQLVTKPKINVCRSC